MLPGGFGSNRWVISSEEDSFGVGSIPGPGGVDFGVPITHYEFTSTSALEKTLEWFLSPEGLMILTLAIPGPVDDTIAASTVPLNSVKYSRVGQWMSKTEYKLFVKTGKIPRTNVLTKGKEGYIKQANKGDYYVEFDINSSILANKNPELGWKLIKSNNKIWKRQAEIRGEILPPPVGINIKHIDTK